MNNDITGSLYGKDLTKLLTTTLSNNIVTRQLSFLSKKEDTYIFTAKTCCVEVFVADHNRLRWRFYNPSQHPVFYFLPHFYEKYVLETDNRSLEIKPVDSFTELINQAIHYIQEQMADILQRPILGDYSWVKDYVLNLKRLKKYNAFYFATKSSDSEERKEIGRMFRRKEEGWEEAIERYFKEHYPDGGKIFEKDPIFHLFPDV